MENLYSQTLPTFSTINNSSADNKDNKNSSDRNQNPSASSTTTTTTEAATITTNATTTTTATATATITTATSIPTNKKKKNTTVGNKRGRKQEKDNNNEEGASNDPQSQAKMNQNDSSQANPDSKKRRITLKDDMSLPISIISKNTNFFLKGIEEEDIEEFGCTKYRDIDKRLGILMNYLISENYHENSVVNQKQLIDLFIPEKNSFQKIIFMKQLILETCYMLLIVIEPLKIGNTESCKPIYNLISRLWMLDDNS